MKNCLITFNDASTGLGDVIALMPYLNKFRVSQNLEIYFKVKNIFFSELFKKTFPEIIFIDETDNKNYDKEIILRHKWDKPLQQVFAEQLGFINSEYIRPKVDDVLTERTIKNKYIVISIQSTSQLKYWNHVNGKKEQLTSKNWDILCKMLRKSGYTPICVDNYESFGIPNFRNYVPKSCVKKLGLPLKDVMEIIKHCEFFIGLSSGISWLAHAMNKPVAMISNFTEDWYEFDLNINDYKRIINKSVCHGCWNIVGKEFDFEYDDWYWCPKHKDTPRQFECHTSITPEMVYEEIKDWLL
jgi:autotransporter strand-loop-strand O-heptosyltransferase